MTADVRPIYLRLRDLIAIGIIDGTYPEGTLLPSVRAFAGQQGANPSCPARPTGCARSNVHPFSTANGRASARGWQCSGCLRRTSRPNLDPLASGHGGSVPQDVAIVLTSALRRYVHSGICWMIRYVSRAL